MTADLTGPQPAVLVGAPRFQDPLLVAGLAGDPLGPGTPERDDPIEGVPTRAGQAQPQVAMAHRGTP